MASVCWKCPVISECSRRAAELEEQGVPVLGVWAGQVRSG